MCDGVRAPAAARAGAQVAVPYLKGRLDDYYRSLTEPLDDEGFENGNVYVRDSEEERRRVRPAAPAALTAETMNDGWLMALPAPRSPLHTLHCVENVRVVARRV